jgi:putative membrane protein
VPAAGVVATLAVTGAVYTRGWWGLHARAPDRFPAARLAAFLMGLGTIALAVASPLDAAADHTLAAHMVQHLVLLVVAPPLVLAGAPLVPVTRGLPRLVTRGLVRPLLRSPLPRVLGHPLVGWLTITLATWAWHVPAAFELALRSDAWHAVEHACFLGSGLLFWWPVVQPWPSRPRMSRWALLPYLLLADLQNTVLAAILTFASHPLYPTYAAHLGPRALDDQVLAGVLMWVPMSLAYLVPVAVVTVRLLGPRGGPAVRPRPGVVDRP